MKMFAVLSLSVLTSLAWAGPQRVTLDELAQRLQRVSLNLEKDIQDYQYSYNKQLAKSAMAKKLERIENITQKIKAKVGIQDIYNPTPLPVPLPLPNPNPNPYPYPGPQPSRAYSAECHIDDDSSLTWGENIVGILQGDSIDQIISECKQISKNSYGTWATSGILNLSFNGHIDESMSTAVCHIDDDSSLTLNETVIGQLVGSNAVELQNICKKIATNIYGTWATAGIVNLNINKQKQYGQMSATCHIDDDSSLTYNEYVVGTIIGPDTFSLSNQCRDLAKKIFGTWATSGIQDISYSRDTFSAGGYYN